PPDDLAKAVNERFGASWTAHEATDDSASGNGRADGSTQPTLKDRIIRVGRQFFRKELADLEQFVLISIFDQSWKDHLYAMDMLRNSIGLQAFAERDPRIAYKKEGYRYFEEMMIGVRDKVTDLIFRARVGAAPQQARSAYRE